MQGTFLNRFITNKSYNNNSKVVCFFKFLAKPFDFIHIPTVLFSCIAPRQYLAIPVVYTSIVNMDKFIEIPKISMMQRAGSRTPVGIDGKIKET